MHSVYNFFLFFLLAPTITYQQDFSQQTAFSSNYRSSSNDMKLTKVVAGFLSQMSAEADPADEHTNFCDVVILGDIKRIRDILENCIFNVNREFLLAQIIIDSTSKIQRKELKSIEQEKKDLVSRRFGFHCSNALIFPEIDNQNLIDQVKSRNVNPRREFIHYIFLAEKNIILRHFEEKTVLRLKYKTGIFIEDAAVYSEVNIEREFQIMEPKTDGDLQVPKYRNRWCSICGRSVRAGNYRMEPYVVFDENKKPIKGHAVTSMIAITHHFNLTLTHEFRQGAFKDKNGNWSGFMLELIEDHFDLWFGLIETHDRRPYVDFSPFVTVEDVIFYVGHPKVKVDWAAILYPFTMGTWALILVSLVCVVPLFYIQLTVKLSKREGMKKMDGFYMAIILPFSALLQESRKVPFRARVLYGIFLFYSIIIGVFYNSNLISYLSFPQRDPIPLTFHQLAQRKDYTLKLTSVPGAASDTFFQEARGRTFTAIKERLIFDRNFIGCIVHAALDKKTACISWPIVVDSILAKNLTLHPNFDPIQKSDAAFSAALSVAYPKQSPYSGNVNRFVGSLRDSGHFTQWKKEAYAYRKTAGRRWMLSQKNIKNSNYRKLDELTRETAGFSTRKPFGLLNFVLCFGSLIAGLFLASFSFFFELVKKLIRNKCPLLCK